MRGDRPRLRLLARAQGVGGAALGRGRVVAAGLGLGADWRWASASLCAVVLAGDWRDLLLVALPEELLFRGVLQGVLAARLRRPLVAALLGAAAFALAHVVAGSGGRGLLTFFPGCLFGWLRWRSGSVWPAVAAHAVANALWLRP